MPAPEADPQDEPICWIYYGPPGTGKTHELQAMLRDDYGGPAKARRRRLTSRNLERIQQELAALTWWEVIALALLGADEKAPMDVGALEALPVVAQLARSRGEQHLGITLAARLRAHRTTDPRDGKPWVAGQPSIFACEPGGAGGYWRLAGDWRKECAHLADLEQRLRAAGWHELQKPRGNGAGTLRRPTQEVRYRLVAFHPGYGYQDFVEGLQPVPANPEEEADAAVEGVRPGRGGRGETGMDGRAAPRAQAGGEASGPQHLRYQVRDGVFKDLCRAAEHAPHKRFAMLIDEINRGDARAIFGELLTLLDPDRRSGAKNETVVTLPYSREQFCIPPNLDVFGTMSTAPGEAPLDQALRRRFEMVAMPPRAADRPGEPLHGLLARPPKGAPVSVPALLTAINRRLEALRACPLGHCVFLPLREIPDDGRRFEMLADIFRYQVLPQLETWFAHSPGRVRMVLGDNQKQDPAAQFYLREQPDLRELFGDSPDLAGVQAKPLYRPQESACSNPDAYLGVYAAQGVQEPPRVRLA